MTPTQIERVTQLYSDVPLIVQAIRRYSPADAHGCVTAQLAAGALELGLEEVKRFTTVDYDSEFASHVLSAMRELHMMSASVQIASGNYKSAVDAYCAAFATDPHHFGSIARAAILVGATNCNGFLMSLVKDWSILAKRLTVESDTDNECEWLADVALSAALARGGEREAAAIAFPDDLFDRIPSSFAVQYIALFSSLKRGDALDWAPIASWQWSLCDICASWQWAFPGLSPDF